jgi:putative transcriptional regulator
VKEVHSRLKVLVADKELRERRTIGVRVAARESGASISTVTRLMNDPIKRVPLDDLGRLCRWLGCEVGDILQMRDYDESETVSA